MIIFIITFVVALAFSAIGFKKYVWFISIGYGFSIAAIGLTFFAIFGGGEYFFTRCATLLLLLYGLRLGGYLTFREMKVSSYNDKMKTEIKSGDGMKISAKIAIWVTAALLYACETSPLLFRLNSTKGTDFLLFLGVVISAFGLGFETLADIQKNAAKKDNPKRFVDTGLYKIVRCPNYLGEMLFWTGVFFGSVNCLHNAFQWIAALLGYLGIIYVMFGGARRLEIRQNRTYGDDPEYQNYVKSTPIMIPFVPLYSVEKYTWLVA